MIAPAPLAAAVSVERLTSGRIVLRCLHCPAMANVGSTDSEVYRSFHLHHEHGRTENV